MCGRWNVCVFAHQLHHSFEIGWLGQIELWSSNNNFLSREIISHVSPIILLIGHGHGDMAANASNRAHDMFFLSFWCESNVDEHCARTSRTHVRLTRWKIHE